MPFLPELQRRELATGAVPVLDRGFARQELALRTFLNRIARLFIVWTSASSLGAAPEIAIAPAVEITWPSQPNRLYQVMSTDNLVAPTWAEVGSPVSGTGATVRKVLYRGDATHGFFRVVELEGTVTNWLAGLSELDFRPAKLVAQDGGIRAEGARANAIGISPADLLTTRFQFDLESQSLRLVQYEVIPEIGVFWDRFFAKDVPESPSGTLGGKSLPEYTWATATGTNIVLNVHLTPGHVFNFGVTDPSREHSVELIGPDGQRMKQSIMPAGAAYVEAGQPILRGGIHQLRIRPRSDSASTPSMSCRLYFANSNPARLRDIADGTLVSTTLRQNTHDYAKYRIPMARGQVLRLEKPDSSVGILVLNSSSVKLGEVVGLPLIFEAPKDDVYYVFVYRFRPTGADSRYSSIVTLGDS